MLCEETKRRQDQQEQQQPKGRGDDKMHLLVIKRGSLQGVKIPQSVMHVRDKDDQLVQPVSQLFHHRHLLR